MDLSTDCLDYACRMAGWSMYLPMLYVYMSGMFQEGFPPLEDKIDVTAIGSRMNDVARSGRIPGSEQPEGNWRQVIESRLTSRKGRNGDMEKNMKMMNLATSEE